ncbi:uncharacterized protein EAF01_000732 [Botrytis porri]|uniref:Uncharacterized protein n=1 Tax=Botrytis porri TaxID=87229 RepID=A0A4Z1L443_9HELO|nr:uncharacterized protein EAF01_000732 [Botrytis porri]KAF7914326.1 hypothetical protein EAF01_000732 [Botrytis porri]TGO91590.1 hypothetical protein BPOR_0023g00150 [Botrytis porri]
MSPAPLEPLLAAGAPQIRTRKGWCTRGCCSKVFLTMILAVVLSMYLALPSLSPTPPGHVAVISPFEIHTVTDFLAAAKSGIMPGNRKTELPLMPEEMVKYLSTSYVEWAPEPFKTQLGSDSVSATLSTAPLARIMMAASGMSDILRAALDSLSIERNMDMMKKRIWHGMSPIPPARWESMGLSKSENIEVALSQIQLIVDVFEYLHTPRVQGRLRDIYNHIWFEFDILQDVLNALEVSNGRSKPAYNLPALWQEYIHSYLFENMAFQSRSFIFTNLLPLYNATRSAFFSQPSSVFGEAGTPLISQHHFRVLNSILDLYIETEFYVVPHTVGFVYRHEPGNVTGLLSDDESSWERNNAIYESIQNARREDFQIDYQRKIKEAAEMRIANDEHSSFGQNHEALQTIWNISDRADAHQAAQPQILNPARVEEEEWVRKFNSVENFGYVIYKMKWKTFLARLESGLDSGWEGMIGVEHVKQKATVHWIEGLDESIFEDDFADAREHFKNMIASQNIPADLSTTTFLVIDSASFASFGSTPGSRNRGFLNVVSADFDPASNSSDGYNGAFKIVDQLVWTELYPLVEHLKCVSLDAFWALARNSPSEVYVGATTEIQRRVWDDLDN